MKSTGGVGVAELGFFVVDLDELCDFGDENDFDDICAITSSKQLGVNDEDDVEYEDDTLVLLVFLAFVSFVSFVPFVSFVSFIM